MKRLPQQEIIYSQASQHIWDDVVSSMHKYTNDSTCSKFFFPEEITNHVKDTAVAFSMLHVNPMPEKEKMFQTKLYDMFHFSLCMGIQIYIKEQQYLSSSFRLTAKTDLYEIRTIKNTITRELIDGVKVYSPINEVMDIFLKGLFATKHVNQLGIPDTEFDSEKFKTFLPVTVLWGYLFAKNMVS